MILHFNKVHNTTHTQGKESKDACRCNDTAISLRAGCELFLRYTTRTSNLETEDFETAKQRIIEVLLQFAIACKLSHIAFHQNKE